jgi:hypothetical protein
MKNGSSKNDVLDMGIVAESEPVVQLASLTTMVVEPLYVSTD